MGRYMVRQQIRKTLWVFQQLDHRVQIVEIKKALNGAFFMRINPN